MPLRKAVDEGGPKADDKQFEHERRPSFLTEKDPSYI